MSSYLGIVRFELGYYLRRISTWVYFAIFLASGFLIIHLAGGAWESVQMAVSGSGGNVKVNSPYVIAGLTATLGLFGVLLRTFEDFRYIGQFDGAAETGADGSEAPAVILLFRATVNGREIHGIDLLHLDEEGAIKEFTVMVRPQSAVQTLSEAVLAGLVADGLVPAAAER